MSLFDLRSTAIKLVLFSKPDFLINLANIFVVFANAFKGMIPVNIDKALSLINFLLLSILSKVT